MRVREEKSRIRSLQSDTYTDLRIRIRGIIVRYGYGACEPRKIVRGFWDSSTFCL